MVQCPYLISHACRGYPPEISPSRVHDSSSSSPTHGGVSVDYSLEEGSPERERMQARRERAEAEMNYLSNIDWDPNNMKQIKVLVHNCYVEDSCHHLLSSVMTII